MISTFLMSEAGCSLVSQPTPDPGRDELDMGWNQPHIGPDFPELQDVPWAGRAREIWISLELSDITLLQIEFKSLTCRIF